MSEVLHRCIVGAEKAILTDQPNLARIYLRRGLSETANGRAFLKSQDLRDSLQKSVRHFEAAMRGFTTAAQSFESARRSNR